MDLDAEVHANSEGFFVVTFFNDQEKSLTEPTVKYIFSKFGLVTHVKYAEHGRVFISYKEKQEALKALEILNMGTKFRVDIDRQPVKKNETEKRIQNEVEDSFIYLRIPPKTKWGTKLLPDYVSRQLFDFKFSSVYSKPKHIASSWLYRGYVKIVFSSKMALDYIIENHKKSPLKWPTDIGGDFEFCNDLPIIYIQSPNLQGRPSWVNAAYFGVIIFGDDHWNEQQETVAKTKIKSVCMSPCRKLVSVVFDTKITKDEVMKAHNKKPFTWHEKVGALEFLNTTEVLSMYDKNNT